MFLYGIRTYDGKYRYIEAHNLDEACSLLGIAISDVKRAIPVQWLDHPPMPEEAKEKLRALHAARREVRKVRYGKKKNND